MHRRLDPVRLVAAAWALRALWRTRRNLRRHALLPPVRVPPPPRLPARGRSGVDAVLNRLRATCLERALILQSWRAAQGTPAEVVIGVKGPTGAFRAHAWLEDELDPRAHEYQELARIPPGAP